MKKTNKPAAQKPKKNVFSVRGAAKNIADRKKMREAMLKKMK